MLLKEYKKEIFLTSFMSLVILAAVYNTSEDNIYNMKMGLLGALVYFLILSSVE